MPTFEVPLQPYPHQFRLSVRDNDYLMRLYYREADEAGWHMDFSDAANQAWKIAGIPLLTGLDLLMQYKFLLLGFELWLKHDYGLDMPAYGDLGSVARLYVVTPDV